MLQILVLHGPNLNLLGNREASIYGTTTLDMIDASLKKLGGELGAQLVIRQSNLEGELVTALSSIQRPTRTPASRYATP
jgi:3-dehydroquinate dehydratase II